MKATIITAALAVLFAGCSALGQDIPSEKELEKLSDKESVILANCQFQKVEEDLGAQGAEEYTKKLTDESIKEIEAGGHITSIQYEMAKDGYYCDAQERKEFAEQARKEQKRQEQIAVFGPPVELWDVRQGLLGGLFVGDVSYQVEKEHTGFWMGISKNKELEVKTSANTEPEAYKLAESTKEKESEGFDFIRVAFYGGKAQDPADGERYPFYGTFVIITSKEGLQLFGDQYPMGKAYEQAKRDFQEEDGIVFLPPSE